MGIGLNYLCAMLEWYDISVVGAFTKTLSVMFCNHSTPLAQMLFGFAMYGVGFLVRPLGALYFGVCTGRYGGDYALVHSLRFATIGSLLLCTAPSYDLCGSFAVLWFVCGRLLHGFAIGGSYGASYVSLMEKVSRPEYKGSKYTSIGIAQLGMIAGMFAGDAIPKLLACVTSEEFCLHYSWRFVMGLSFVVSVLVLLMYKDVKATPLGVVQENSHTSVVVQLGKVYNILLLALPILCMDMVCFHAFYTFVPVYFSVVPGYKLLFQLCLAVCFVSTGYLIDCVSKQVPKYPDSLVCNGVLMYASILLLGLSYCACWGTHLSILWMGAVFSALYVSIAPWMCSLFGVLGSSTAQVMGLYINVVSICGGFAPMGVSLLIERFGILSFSYLLHLISCACMLSVVCRMLFSKDL